MADPSPNTPAPVTPEAFLRDRQGMLHAFTSFTTVTVIALAVVLALMAIFLL